MQQRFADGRATDMESELLSGVAPPATDDDLETAETRLGFALPPLLRRVYSELANGGVGPGYGLIGAGPGGARDDLGETIDDIYERWRRPDDDDALWSWPEGLLVIAGWGCAVYSCVDCTTADGKIVIFDPNEHEAGGPWLGTQVFRDQGRSLESWLAAWAADTDLWAEIQESARGACQ